MMRYAWALHCRIGAGGEPWWAAPMGLTGGLPAEGGLSVVHSDTSGLPIDKMPLSITKQAPGVVRNPGGDPLQSLGVCKVLPCGPAPGQDRRDGIPYQPSPRRSAHRNKHPTDTRTTGSLHGVRQPARSRASFPTRVHAKQGSGGKKLSSSFDELPPCRDRDLPGSGPTAEYPAPQLCSPTQPGCMDRWINVHGADTVSVQALF